MKAKIQAVRGMNDLLPHTSKKYNDLMQVLIDTLISYGYENMQTPIVEKTTTFNTAIGEITDIVEKEMYSWQDGKESLSLRPEGTAGIVRAMIEHNLPREGVQKIFYHGAMFRHERPQKGRYRQFNQFGAEVFGANDIKVDVELLEITNNLWQQLNVDVNLEINSLGSTQAREKYKEHLLKYFKKYKNHLDKDSLRRLSTNILRILDSKNPAMQDIINNAPKLLDNLDATTKKDFDKLLNYLEKLNINYKINHNLVRGLDYYNSTVFEWVSDKLGAQATICAGGRYDNLIEKMGGTPTYAIGFAIGIERLSLLINKELTNKKILFYLATQGDKAKEKSLVISQLIHKNLIKFILYNDLTNASLKSQLKKADKKNADYAIIIGDTEVKNNTIIIKPLKTRKQQQIVNDCDLNKFIKQILQGQ